MNIRNYIESGILDVYVLEGLSQAESSEVEELANVHTEISEEINHIKASLERLSSVEHKSPSPELKANIFKFLNENIKESSYLEPVTQVVKMDVQKPSSWTMLSIAASWLLVALFGGLSYHFYTKWKQSEVQLVALQTQNKELADNFNTTNFKYKEASSQLSLISDSSFKIVTLKAVPGKPSTFANILWSKSNHELFISSNSLPATPSGKQYQLWAIVAGKPVDAGMIVKSEAGILVKMKDIENATAFAITLEADGGSKTPTIEEMYVMGLI